MNGKVLLAFVAGMVVGGLGTYIDDILGTIYYDDEKKCLMRSVTVRGGDAEQIPLIEK